MAERLRVCNDGYFAGGTRRTVLFRRLVRTLDQAAVSDLVNSPKPDDPRWVEPVQIDWDMFERQWWGER